MTRGVASAATFLTRFSVGDAGGDARVVAAAAPYYSVVGGALGGSAGAVGVALALALPSTVAAALVVALAAVATGAMHLDALADTADAVGGRTPADRLRIMRESSVGAFGATAVTLYVVIEVAAIAELLEDGVGSVPVFVAAFAASRAAAPPLAALLPYARAEEAVPAFVTGKRALAGVVVAGALCIPAGVGGVVVLAGTSVVTAASTVIYRRWLAGITGDSLGATVAVAEASALVAAVAVR